MLVWLGYSAAALVAAAWCRSETKRTVALLCAGSLLAGMLLDPWVASLDPLIAYTVVALLNTLFIWLIPCHRHYLLIPLLFVCGLAYCAWGAVTVLVPGLPNPYSGITHGLNIVQSLVLLGGSDRLLAQYHRYRALRYPRSAYGVHRVLNH